MAEFGRRKAPQEEEERPIEALRRRKLAAKAEAEKALREGRAPGKPADRPRIDARALEREVDRNRRARQRKGAVKGLVVSLLGAVAAAVVLTIYFFPALTLHGQSMEPALTAGNMVLLSKTAECGRGDLIAFSYDNEISVKRIVAVGGDTVDMDGDGRVTVNGQLLDEPYVKSRALGQCDEEFPLTVPDGKYFVLGDNRPVSVDSRTKSVGTVAGSQVVGRVVFRLWPLGALGPVD